MCILNSVLYVWRISMFYRPSWLFVSRYMIIILQFVLPLNAVVNVKVLSSSLQVYIVPSAILVDQTQGIYFF